jgi:cytochrome c5
MWLRISSMRPVVLALLLTIAGCSKERQISEQEVAQYNRAFANAKLTRSVQAKWARSCALCHVAGQGGAPRLGKPAEWGPRLDKGRPLLMKHTLEGFNKMPPLGYCMDCDLGDFAAMINLMSGQQP